MIFKKKFLKVGIVGCGAIGTSLVNSISKDFKNKILLTALYDIDKSKSEKLSLSVRRDKKLSVNSLNSLIKKVNLVIECASAKVSFDIALETLKQKRNVMVLSVGGIANNISKLEELALKKNVKVYVPSGAICGIDALKAASFSQVNKVTLITRKFPNAFKGVKYVEDRKIDLDNFVEEEKVIFEGSASEAIINFPQNINVAAVLSLAGLGLNNTSVKIIASKKALRNIHEIEIESQAAKIRTSTENQIHPENPKTSFLAVLSALALLKQIISPVQVGT